MELSESTYVRDDGLIYMVFDVGERQYVPHRVYGIIGVSTGHVWNITKPNPGTPDAKWMGTEDGTEFRKDIEDWLRGIWPGDEPDEYKPLT